MPENRHHAPVTTEATDTPPAAASSGSTRSALSLADPGLQPEDIYTSDGKSSIWW